MRATSWLHAVLLAALCVGAGGIRPASACTCYDSQTPCERYASSPIVFVGDVLSSETVDGWYRMRVRVVRALKGIAEATTTDVWSHMMCGTRLEKGARYAIHAARTWYGFGWMEIHGCGGNVRIAPGDAGPELPPVPGSIYGKVWRFNENPGGGVKPWEPLPSVRVTLDLPAGPVTTSSDRLGRFRFGDIPAGKYQLSVNAGQALTSVRGEPPMSQQVILPDHAACAAPYFMLEPDGTSGRVP
jgi:hypothetical protein